MHSVQRREAYLYQTVPFMSCSINDMKYLDIDFINKQTGGSVGINAFGVGIDATKVAKVVRLSQSYNAIVGVFTSNIFLC